MVVRRDRRVGDLTRGSQQDARAAEQDALAQRGVELLSASPLVIAKPVIDRHRPIMTAGIRDPYRRSGHGHPGRSAGRPGLEDPRATNWSTSWAGSAHGHPVQTAFAGPRGVPPVAVAIAEAIWSMRVTTWAA